MSNQNITRAKAIQIIRVSRPKPVAWVGVKGTKNYTGPHRDEKCVQVSSHVPSHEQFTKTYFLVKLSK